MTLSSITVTTTGRLIIIKSNFYGTGSAFCFPEATVRTLSVAAVAQSCHGEDDTANKRKTTDDRSNDNRREVAFGLEGTSDGRWLNKERKRTY
jgi:hypothetical protein